MTHSHPHGHATAEAVVHVADVELADRLRERGMRMTVQRERVMQAVTRLVHATPEQIADAVPDVDLTTVYRTVDTLEEIGLLRHTHLGHGAPSYRLASDDHVHVVCHHCGTVVDAPDGLAGLVADTLRDGTGFILDRSHLAIFGACADCAAASSTSEGPL
ncbi:MAG TPA: transcriptional repressor [Jatrophihabitans sp.]|jgi:Fur family ferric uptake transcriptional regulator